MLTAGRRPGSKPLSADAVDMINGSGIGDTSRRSGLANLLHRAESLGGRLLLGQAEGGGTRLEWRVPLLTPG